jgi:hypothetical protein
MGNFISSQIGQERNSGIVLKMRFEKGLYQGENGPARSNLYPDF